MAEVVCLPGIARRSTAASDLTPDAPLRAALDAGLKDVAIVGRRISGEIEVWSSASDADTAVGLLTRGITWLAQSEQVDGPGE